MLQMLGLLAVLDKTQQPSSSISVQVVEVLAAAADFELLVRINFYKYQKTVPHYLLGQSGLVC